MLFIQLHEHFMVPYFFVVSPFWSKVSWWCMCTS